MHEHRIVRRDIRTSWLIDDSVMSTPARFVLCLRNPGATASLEKRKVYRVIPDAESEALGLVRVIDESGEDDLDPARFFVAIEVPRSAVKAFAIRSA